MADLLGANIYFANEVLHTAEWDEASDTQRQKALRNAENQLYRLYKTYNKETRPLPDAAIYEQALWLLRIDDTIRRAEQGVSSVSVSGININISRAPSTIAPTVYQLVGRRVGRSVIY